MTQQFTASEVRDWERAYKGTGAAKVFGAFADLLEAQEMGVPVMVVNHVSSAEHDLPIGMKLYAHPAPSDAERLAEAQPELDGVQDVMLAVLSEVEAAISKFPTWPNDPLHAVGVLNEECGELNKAVLQHVYEPHKNHPGDVRKEAIQTAAMALRFIAGLPYYVPAPGAQFRQTTLAAQENPNG